MLGPMPRVTVRPELLTWARERAGYEPDQLRRRFPSLARWERGERHPSLKSLQRYARAVHVALEQLYLDRPPVERLPIPDLRAKDNSRLGRPSPDLLETVEVCLKRQAWYREFARGAGDAPRAWVGSLRRSRAIAEAGAAIREDLGLTLDTQRKPPNWVDALRRLSDRAEALGILVMCSSVVLNN